MKIGSASTNYTSDISIKKFGVETLLHKKIESDRVFAEAVEEEKNELLYIMNTQKTFEMTEENKFRFGFSKSSIKIFNLHSLVFNFNFIIYNIVIEKLIPY